MKKNKSNIVLAIVQEKCPQCSDSKVFHKPKHFFALIPQMKSACENCGYHYEREPGFYQGAMFVSYGLSLIEGVILFFVLQLAAPNMPTLTVVSSIIALIFLLSMRNFRLSRMIWLYLLPQ
jgi:uncharacterized protein (DUF983 family)